jgi:hypothetical protein
MVDERSTTNPEGFESACRCSSINNWPAEIAPIVVISFRLFWFILMSNQS